MHINPDEDIRGRAKGWKKKLITWAPRSIEKITLQDANVVLPVYRPILPYLQRIGVNRIEVIYNIPNQEFLKKKENYGLHNPIKVISVGRLIPEKFPVNLIMAIKKMNVSLTIVGNWPKASLLHQVARDVGVSDHVHFIPSVTNDKLCTMLPEFDIFATHSEYFEVSKSVLEPLLTGLPVVINKRKGKSIPEFQGDFLILVENTPEGYRHALEKLIKDHKFRESLGHRAYAHAQKNWAPGKMEKKIVEIYKQVMQEAGDRKQI
jgi:glycosyltransferase involved in cell wall biosynthesis